MTPSSREYLAAIERPLQFLAKGDERSFRSVRNLSQHIQEVCRKAIADKAEEKQVHLFRSLQDLFSGFEELPSPEKRERIEKALDLIEGRSAVASSSVRCFHPEEHPIYSNERLREAHERLAMSVQYVKGVGPAIAEKLAAANVRTLRDLLFFWPTRYEDRREFSHIRDLSEGAQVTVMADVIHAGVAFYRGLRRRVFEVVLEDGTGRLRLKWFHFAMGSIDEKIKPGHKMIVSGKVKMYKNHPEIHHPDFEMTGGTLDSISFGRVVPVYREVGGLYQKTLRKILHTVVTQYASDRLCSLPPDICKRLDLLPPWKAIVDIQEPPKVLDLTMRSDAHRSLAFEELFFYCLSLALRKKWTTKRPGISFSGPTPRADKMMQHLPFTLTQSQVQVLETIRKDMASAHPMNRLLQGDVGSGKTILAFLAALRVLDHGYQAVFLAPTEILAEQHWKVLSAWGKNLGVQVGMMVGKMSEADRKKIVEDLRSGQVGIVVGTHALFESDIRFKSLGLLIVDEQHRFGVMQRAELRDRGMDPDVLVMSATPIPRTLALTLYGDLDVSILAELPAGRKPIETRIFAEKERSKVYERVREEVKRGRQTFIVYPLVLPSEHLEAKDATSMAAQLQSDVFPEARVKLLHGQMTGAEKEEIMSHFAAGEIDILVATTVIEVGIDVPNATLMVIEHPERFGLAQLHQLRGRVGRGSEKSSCLLLVPPKVTQLARQRLRIFSQTHDGFLLAEEDLRVRGPGDFFGVAQSGLPAFDLAVFPRDLDLLESARREAFALLVRDPELSMQGSRHLKWVLDEAWTERLRLVRVG